MVKDLWEFMSKESKARIIFIGVLVGVLALIAIPYLVSVLSHHENNIGADLPDYTEIITEPEPDTTTSSEKVAAEPEPNSDSGAESAPTAEPAETSTYAAYAQSTPSSTSQPVAQTAAAPSEPIHRTSVDDNSGHDDGYTASGIDDPGADDPMQSDDQISEEDGEV